MPYLADIKAVKLTEIEQLRQLHTEKSLWQKIESSPREIRSFSSALMHKPLNLIAEVKRASPSKGIIRTDFDPVAIALEFESKGAAALSVLTDSVFFKGSLDYIAQIRNKVSVPILRKDFVLDPLQVMESYLAGADAILLIIAMLSLDKAIALHGLAQQLGLSVLVEIHTAEELAIACQIPNIALIGVNNRNLDTFEVDVDTSLKLINQTPVIWISESGLSTPLHLEKIKQAGYHAALIGEGLARNPNLIDFFV